MIQFTVQCVMLKKDGTVTVKVIREGEICSPLFSLTQLQYQAMGLCDDSYEEEDKFHTSSSSIIIRDTEEALKYFDDPTYITKTKVRDNFSSMFQHACISGKIASEQIDPYCHTLC